MKSLVAATLGLGEVDLQVFRTAGCDKTRVTTRWFAGIECPVNEEVGTMIIRESMYTYHTEAALRTAMESRFFPLDQDPFTDGEGRRVIFRVER